MSTRLHESIVMQPSKLLDNIREPTDSYGTIPNTHKGSGGGEVEVDIYEAKRAKHKLKGQMGIDR